jgi:hypothetical protein
MDPLMNPYLSRIHARAFQQERLRDAGYYRVGEPSKTLRFVGGLASGLESLGGRIRRWSQAGSTNEVAASRRTPSAR